MTKVNVFVSFDFEHDQALRDLLLAQDKNADAPFQTIGWSVEELLTDAWKKNIRERIRHVDQVIFLCGEHTSHAKGVGAEFAITQEEQRPYFLLQGSPTKVSRKPQRAAGSDKLYAWTWDNIKLLIGGAR